MAIEFFKPQYRTIQNPVDLNVLANTYNTLEKGHQQAIDTATAYMTALSELPVNEAERPYIQKLSNDIKETIEENKRFGNAYYALDDIKMLTTNISNDAGLRGRLKAQADYKAYIDNLNKRPDLSEADKEYFREVNQYYYQDKYDNKGNVIGGTEWKPLDREVSAPDTVKMMQQAMQMVAAEGGQSNAIYYKSKTGGYTTNPNLSVDNIPYYSVSGKYERITKDKIREALNAVIANTDGAIEGLQQDYKIAKWRHNKQEGLIIDETTDDKGLPLTFDQYLDKRFKGFYHTASYSRYYENSITPLAGMKLDAVKSTASSQSTKSNKQLTLDEAIRLSPNTVTGPYVQQKESALAANIAGYSAAMEKMRGLFDRYGLEWNNADMADNYNRAVLAGNGVPDKAIFDAYNEYIKYMNKYKKLAPKDKETNDAIRFKSALDGGVDLSTLGTDNPYANEYNKLAANIYKNGSIEIPVIDEAKNIDYKSLGLELKYDNNGNMYFVSGIEDSSQLINISKLITPYIKRKKRYTVTTGTPLPPSIIEDNTIFGFNEAINIYNKAAEYSKPVITEPVYIPTQIVSDLDVAQTIDQFNVASGKTSDVKAVKDFTNQQLINNLGNVYGPRINLGMSFEADPMTYNVTTEQQYALAQIVKYAYAEFGDKNVHIGYDKNTLSTVANIHLTKDFKDNPEIKQYCKILGIADDQFTINFIADNLWNTETKNALLTSPEYANKVEFTTDVQSGIDEWDLKSGYKVIKNGDNYFIERNGLYHQLPDYEAAANAVGTDDLINRIIYENLIIQNQGGYGKEVDASLRKLIAIRILPYIAPDVDINSFEANVIINDIINNINKN